ncbi:hypothetical protein NW762_013518 [Fusarium torreyae]|uniref:Uncharacterized protein n=1 Tax=Fusarium torreyae TaxID=1237075 RepID=A0A9W8RKI7_9HYPO|nr:hypothetical protein NW762_013518 [Fusarium torreyae]
MANTAAVVNLQAPEEGDTTWTVEQVEVEQQEEEEQAENTKSIDWGHGPIHNVGTLNLDTFEIKVNLDYVGIRAGTVQGNLKDGLGVNIDLFAARGEQKFYLKNGNELWTYVDIRVTFDGLFSGDYKIFSF